MQTVTRIITQYSFVLALFVAGTFLVGCKGGDGATCKQDDDCSSEVCCKPVEGVTTRGSCVETLAMCQAPPTRDASVDGSEDAQIDAELDADAETDAMDDASEDAAEDTVTDTVTDATVDATEDTGDMGDADAMDATGDADAMDATDADAMGDADATN